MRPRTSQYHSFSANAATTTLVDSESYSKDMVMIFIDAAFRDGGGATAGNCKEPF